MPEALSNRWAAAASRGAPHPYPNPSPVLGAAQCYLTCSFHLKNLHDKKLPVCTAVFGFLVALALSISLICREEKNKNQDVYIFDYVLFALTALTTREDVIVF